MKILNYKIVLILIASFFISITSCKKDVVEDLNQNEVVGTGSGSGTSSSEEVDQWPNEIDDYVDTNYPQTAIDYVEKSEDGFYHVYLLDATELVFDEMGIFIEIGTGDDLDDDGDNGDSGDSEDSGDNGESDDSEDGISLTEGEVPVAILDYLAANHPDVEVTSIELSNSTTIKVKLADGTKLYFDLDGNILEGPNTDGDDGDSGDSTDDGEDDGSTDDDGDAGDTTDDGEDDTEGEDDNEDDEDDDDDDGDDDDDDDGDEDDDDDGDEDDSND